jgi:hypothetical protein
LSSPRPPSSVRFWREEEQSRYDALSSSAEIQAKAAIATLIDKLIETGGSADRANAP